jgi:hypothetical protein
MKLTRAYLALAILFTALTTHAQWVEKNNGLNGGSITDLLVKGSSIFAIVSAESDGRIFKSTNSGGSWTISGSSLPRKIYRTLYTDGTRVLVGGQRGIYSSSDDGTNWTDISTGLTFDSPFSTVNAISASGGNLFANISGEGVFRRADNGNSWTKLTLSETNLTTTVLATGTTVLVGTTGLGLYWSDANGESLAAIDMGVPGVKRIYDLAISGTKILAATDKGLFTSTNNGLNWSLTNDKLLQDLRITGTKLYAASTFGEILVSTDDGVTLTTSNVGFINVQSGARLISGTSVGIYSSDDNGVNWYPSSNGINGITITSIASLNGVLFAGTQGGIYKSTDGANNWIASGLQDVFITDIEIIGSTIFAAGSFGIYRSTNNGNNWTYLLNGPTYTNGLSKNTLAVNGTDLYVASTTLYRTSDNGNTWVSLPVPAPAYPTSVAIHNNSIFTGSSAFWKSSDNGANWTVLTSLESSYGVRSVFANESAIFVLTMGGTILKSTNLGSSWTEISVNKPLPTQDIPPSNYAFTMATVGSTLFAGTNGNGIYKSTDGGNTWTAINDGLGGKYIFYLGAIGSTFYAGTSAGLYVRPLSEINDLTPPVISNNTVESINANAGVTITASVTDGESAVSKVTIEYRSQYAGGSTTVTDITPSGNTYSLIVSADKIGPLGLEYKITATSLGGTSSTGTAFKVVRVNAEGITIPYNAFGNESKNYRIISVPLELTNKKVADVFDELMPEDDQKWRIYKYEPGGSKRNVELKASENIEPGKGYWLIVKDNPGKALQTGGGFTVVASTAEPFSISLKTGYNLIGNPYNYNLLWSDVKAANAGLGDLLTYSGKTSFDAGATVLKAGEGGFVYVDSGQPTLSFPTKYNSSAGRKSEPIPTITNSLADENWEVQLTLRQGEAEAKLAGFGMNAQASAAYDTHDWIVPPQFLTEYLQVTHTKKINDDNFAKDIVPTAAEHEWEFFVNTSFADDLITLAWNNTYFGNNDRALYLWDVTQQRAIDMRTTNTFTFDKRISGRFKVFYGSKEFVEDRTQVDGLVLHPVFPNPAQQHFTVAFTLPKTTQLQLVAITITDATGRMASTYEKEFASGYQQVEGSTERMMPGCYIITVHAGIAVKHTLMIVR